MKRKRQYTRQYKANMKIQVKLRDDGRCVACGRQVESIHHVFFEKNRHISDEHPDFMVCLCRECHQGTNGVHGKNGGKLDLRLKQEAQLRYEKDHSREDFIRLIGKNYLEVEDGSESAGHFEEDQELHD